MVRVTCNYNDYDNNNRTESFYFNFTQAEMAELEFGTVGSMHNVLEKIVSAKNLPELIHLFKIIIKKAYGEKSPDGRYFMKSDEISNKFECSPVYSTLYMKLATDDDFGAKFVNGIIPDEKTGAFAIVELTI